MGKKPLEVVGVDADFDEMVEGDEGCKADETIGVAEGGETDEEVEGVSPEDMAEVKALEAEMKRKFSGKRIEEEFLGEEDVVAEGDDLSAKVQLLKSLTGGRVGRGRRKSVVTGCINYLRREKLRLVNPGKEIGVAGENRPLKRADCVKGKRPCPWAGCKYHLYLDVSSRLGSIKHNFPGLEVDELPVSCALDVADAGGVSREDVGVLLNITHQAIDLILRSAIDKIADSPFGRELEKWFSKS